MTLSSELRLETKEQEKLRLRIEPMVREGYPKFIERYPRLRECVVAYVGRRVATIQIETRWKGRECFADSLAVHAEEAKGLDDQELRTNVLEPRVDAMLCELNQFIDRWAEEHAT